MLPYRILKSRRLTSLLCLAARPAPRLLEEPARFVLTDLRTTQAITIDKGASLATAHEEMRENMVRLLFVVNSEHAVEGIVTAYDLYGESPVRVATEEMSPLEDVVVSKVMASIETLPAFDVAEVDKACIGDIYHTLQSYGSRYGIVADSACRDLCGLFSAHAIAKQTGLSIAPFELPQTFGALAKAIGG